MRHLAQMPVVLIPIHFDREPVNRLPSCQRSIVLRPFISNDFMTGIPAIPGSEQMPTDVSFWLKIMIYEQYCNNFFFLFIIAGSCKNLSKHQNKCLGNFTSII